MRRSAYAKALAMAVCTVAALSIMTGCRASDALKEIIYDQSADIIDYDNPNKYKINDSESDQTDPNMPSSEISDDAPATDEKQNLVVYSSDPNSPQFSAKQSLWANDPEFEGLEASSKVAFYEDDKGETIQDLGTQQDDPPKEKEKEEEDRSESNQDMNMDYGSDGLGESTEPGEQESSKAKKKGDKKTQDTGGNDGGDEEVEEEEGDEGLGEGDLTGDYVDTPKVQSGVAAYGDAAVLVQMIGGEGALVAADKELLKSDFSKVFADEGAKDIVQGWDGDGHSGGEIDANAIIKSGASAVLVYTSSYLSTADTNKLKKADVAILKIYKMTNSTYIKKDVTLIGDMLEDITKGTSVDMALDYNSWHDNLVKTVSGNKLAGDTLYERGTTESKAKKKYDFDDSAKTTLLLDAWDSSASYNRDIDGWKPSGKGVATATVGYEDSPVSFYIQAGGMKNNAAAKGAVVSAKSGSVIAWQFNGNIALMSKNRWSYNAGGALDGCIDVKGDGWNTCLFTARSAMANTEYAVTECFGSESFPNIITATQEVKSKLIENSKKANSVYHPYDIAERSGGGISVTGYGKLTSGGSLVFSSIGANYDNKPYENFFSGSSGIPDDVVYVNPHGLFSSWTDGNPEAVLETAWVNDVVNGDGTKVGYEDYIKEFYEMFYRYELDGAELKTIEAGLEK